MLPNATTNNTTDAATERNGITDTGSLEIIIGAVSSTALLIFIVIVLSVVYARRRRKIYTKM